MSAFERYMEKIREIAEQQQKQAIHTHPWDEWARSNKTTLTTTSHLSKGQGYVLFDGLTHYLVVMHEDDFRRMEKAHPWLTCQSLINFLVWSQVTNFGQNKDNQS